jgi:hypothetical protein
MLEQNTLAAPAPANNYNRFTFFDAEIDLLENDVRAETFFEITHLDHTF